MHDVLAALEAFHQKAANIFDRVEGACTEVEGNLDALTDRLERAAARVEAARGSTRPLNVCSARLLEAPRSAQRTKRLFDSDTLASLSSAAPLPQLDVGRAAPPSSRTAAEDLARVVRCIAAPSPGAAASSARAPEAGSQGGRLLPVEGRLGAVSELFLFNSAEQPYRGKPGSGYVDNLAAPDEVEVKAASLLTPWQKGSRLGETALRLDEDEVDPLMEDLRFKPRPVKEVTFDLPDVLPDLGGPVADLMWRQQDQLEEETQRPAWDSQSALSRSRAASLASGAGTRRASTSHTPAGGGNRADPHADVLAAARFLQSAAAASSAEASPAPQAAKAAPAAAPPAKKAAAPLAKEPAKSVAPPPPPNKGKGKGAAGADSQKAAPPPPPAKKGKGKGKGGAPKPPPPKPGGPPKAPAAKGKAPSGGGGGKAEMFAAISKGGHGLRKVAPPKERSGAPVGRVL